MKKFVLLLSLLITIAGYAQKSTLYFGRFTSGTAPYEEIITLEKIEIKDENGVVDSSFQITGGLLRVDGVYGAGVIQKNGVLDGKATSLLKRSKGRQISFIVDYIGADNVGRKGGLSLSIE